MPILSALPLAIAASLAAQAPDAAPQPTISAMRAPAAKAVKAEAIPSPKRTDMRVVFDAAGKSHIVCDVVANPAYKQALRDARQKQAETGR